MNKEVNFEIAKLLKEKGFNEEVRDYYEEKDGAFYHSQYFRDNISINEKHKGFVTAPTIAEVVMWLYEKHGIWIGVTKYKNHVTDVNDDCYFTPDNGRHIYKTPTEAYEARINFTLENLI